jgi:hypothetical protein
MIAPRLQKAYDDDPMAIHEPVSAPPPPHLFPKPFSSLETGIFGLEKHGAP